MIRTVVATHLSAQDIKHTTVLLNNRTVGYLSSDREVNAVSATHRDVQVIVSLSNQSVYYDPRYNRERLRMWSQAYRELQTGGLKVFPQIINDHRLSAEFLYVFTDKVFLAWQDRSKALYLHRNHKFFRIQPIAKPSGIFPEGWMAHTDFYAFTPRTDDIILRLPSRFPEEFDIDYLEDVLSETNQLSVTMNELTGQLRSYRRTYDQSWLGIQVKRIEHNAVIEKTGDTGNQDFTRLIDRSKASRVRFSQELLPAEAIADKHHYMQGAEWKKNSRETGDPRRGNVRKTNFVPKRAYRPETGPINRQEQKEAIRRLENQRKRKDKMLDNLQSFSFEPYIDKGKKQIKRIFYRNPNEPWLGHLSLLATILVVVLILVGLIKLIGGGDKSENETTGTTVSTATADPEDIDVSAYKKTLEVQIIVKASNLQIRSKPEREAPLVATVSRGDKVIQLSEVYDGWVLVRVDESKIEGFVYADYLLE